MSKALLKDIKSALRKKTIDLSAMRELAARDGARLAFEKARGLSRVVDKGSLEAIEIISRTGADPDLPEDHPPLVMVVDHPFMKAADRARAVALLLEQGADVNACDWTGRGAVERAAGRRDGIDCLRLLSSHPRLLPVTRANAVSAVIRKCGDADYTREMLDLLIDPSGNLATPDRMGLAAVHAAAAHGNPEAMRLLVEAGADVDAALPGDAAIDADHCTHPDGGVVPKLVFPAGLTALDVAERTLELYRLKRDGYGDTQAEGTRGATQRAARIERLEATIAALTDLGAARGAVQAKGSEPPYRAEVDALLCQLAEAAGADLAAIKRLSEGTSTCARGPWGYLSAVVERAAPLLRRGGVKERSADLWLGRLLLRRDTPFMKPTLDYRNFPEEAHACLAEKELVGAHGDSYLVLWKYPETNRARVCEVRKDGFDILGVDVLDFLRRQVALLCGLPEPAAHRAGPPQEVVPRAVADLASGRRHGGLG